MEKRFALAPMIWFVALLVFSVVGGVMDPAVLIRNFDQGGYSPFELLTLPFFAAIIPLIWWKCPFAGSKVRRIVLCSMVSIVVGMALVKEMDLHLVAIHWLYPDIVANDGSLLPGLYKPNGKMLVGTPFKMRVLTNAGVPIGMKLWIMLYFGAFFGVFAAGFAYLFKIWLLGVFKLVPSAWSFGCLGASGVIVQVADRLPSWLGHRFGDFSTARAMCTALEEGFEMMIAVFAIITICQGFRELRGQVRHFAV